MTGYATISIDGAVLAWEPPSLVEFEWEGGPTQARGSRVRFELSPDGAGSRLVLTPQPDGRPAGRPAWDDLREHYVALTGQRA